MHEQGIDLGQDAGVDRGRLLRGHDEGQAVVAALANVLDDHVRRRRAALRGKHVLGLVDVDPSRRHGACPQASRAAFSCGFRLSRILRCFSASDACTRDAINRRRSAETAISRSSSDILFITMTLIRPGLRKSWRVVPCSSKRGLR